MGWRGTLRRRFTLVTLLAWVLMALAAPWVSASFGQANSWSAVVSADRPGAVDESQAVALLEERDPQDSLGAIGDSPLSIQAASQAVRFAARPPADPTNAGRSHNVFPHKTGPPRA
jgi:hypothetical protein